MKVTRWLYVILICTAVLFCGSEGCTSDIKKRNTNKQSDSTAIAKKLDQAYALKNQDPDSSLLLTKEALIEAKQANEPLLQTDALNQIAKYYKAKGNNELAAEYFSKAMLIDDSVNHIHGMARDRYGLSLIYKNIGKLDTAILMSEKAAELWATLPNKQKEVGDALVQTGVVYKEQSDYSQALRYYYRALDTAAKYEKTNLKADVYMAIGTINQLQGYDSIALVMYKKSLAINLEKNNRKEIAKCYNNIGSIYVIRQQTDSAYKYLSAAIYIYDSLNLEESRANVYSNLSLNYALLGNSDSLDSLSFRTLRYREQMNNKKGIAISYSNIGENLIRKRKLSEAIIYLKRSDSLFNELGNFNNRIAVNENLKQAFVLSGNFAKAFEHSEIAIELKDKLAQEVHRASEIIIAYKDEQNKRILAETQCDIKQAELQRVYIITISLGVIILLLLIMFIQQIRARRAEKRERENKAKIEDLIRSQEITAVRTMLETQEKERRRIAQDLHDSLGVKLSTAKLYYNMIEEENPNLPDSDYQQLKKANVMLDEACEEIRTVASNLHSGELVTFGVVKAVETLCQNIEATGKLCIDFQANGMDARLDNLTEFNIYQIIQESLANVLRHAHASEVTVQLQRQNGTINLMVEDNGIGFEVSKVQGTSGIGMKSLRERATKINATLLIDSHPGHGTTVTLDIPVH